jgi:potassium-transporting ATPase ATP-binding subunit
MNTKTLSSTFSFLTSDILLQALKDSIRKFHPKSLVKNPVMFVVAVGSAMTTGIVFQEIFAGHPSSFNIQVTLWLWFTVFFANFAEAIAEGRGKAQAEALKKSRSQIMARKKEGDNEAAVPATQLRKGDIVICEAGNIIPSDGIVIEGIASVDESAITGESAPVIRESGEDRSAVTGGTKVLSDRIIIRVTSEPGNTFLDRIISLVEGSKRKKTPNEIALTILLSALTIIFLLVVATLPAFVHYSEKASGQVGGVLTTLPVLIALLVCLIPTTIGGLLSAIGISGMDRLIRQNVIATSGRAAEAAGDVDVLLLDKTGTITFGNRMATDFFPAPGISREQLADAAQLSSLADETPEGRSIVILAKEKYKLRGREVTAIAGHFVPFSAHTRMSGVDIPDGSSTQRSIRKGAAEAIKIFITEQKGMFSKEVQSVVEELARKGSTPLVVAENNKVLGVIQLKDVVKGGIKERFAQLRAMGIRTVMITGDNPLTAAAIAAEAGVDDFIAEAKPEDKLQRIRDEQANGRLVGMIGDGTNDAPALAQADVGIAMNSGTQAAREAGNMVDLDSNPTKLIEVVETGKKLLMTRGALTTFSFANDVAKYFAIIPAMAGGLYAPSTLSAGPLSALNIMKLASPQSAILSAVIFNALIIIALIPLALRGVRYRPVSASAVLLRNLWIYGVGGIIIPFIGIKLIDILIVALRVI